MPDHEAVDAVDASAPTCAQCGYDLRGAWLTVHPGRTGGAAAREIVGGSTTCPECGTTGIAVAFGHLVTSRRTRREIIANLGGMVAAYVFVVVGVLVGAPHLGAGLGLLAFLGAWVVTNVIWLLLVQIIGSRSPRDVVLAHLFISLCTAMLAAAAVLT